MESHYERLYGKSYKDREGIKMEFATTIILSNGLMAAVIYIVVTWIWED